MAASVRIEDEAFSDERYEDLAHFAGLVDADHARGKMIRLWRQCTLEQSHEINPLVAVRFLGPNAVEDRAEGLHVKIGHDSVVQSTSMAGNPSDRRDGMTIAFSCEGCGGGINLKIVQHKGTTYCTFDKRPVGNR